jgi:hypothetical protein
MNHTARARIEQQLQVVDGARRATTMLLLSAMPTLGWSVIAVFLVDFPTKRPPMSINIPSPLGSDHPPLVPPCARELPKVTVGHSSRMKEAIDRKVVSQDWELLGTERMPEIAPFSGSQFECLWRRVDLTNYPTSTPTIRSMSASTHWIQSNGAQVTFLAGRNDWS